MASLACACFSLALLSLTVRSFSALVQQQPLVLEYHNGPLLKGNITVNLIWYGKFTPTQRSVILDFLNSLSPPPRRATAIPAPSVAAWWSTTANYKGGAATLSVGKQFLHEAYTLGKSLKNYHLQALASKPAGAAATPVGGETINVVLTAKDVAVNGFCMNRCGTHGSTRAKARSAYVWVGNPELQCPGYCAWPFYRPVYGPQTPPLVAPNGDVGADGMIISLATALAGAVTNPFSNGYYQGRGGSPMYEAVSACAGIFGMGAYPGYAGVVRVDKTNGASYNALGVNGRKFLLPAMWDPKTRACSPVAI